MVLFLWVCFLDFLDAFFRYGSKNPPDLWGYSPVTYTFFATVKSWNVTPSAAVQPLPGTMEQLAEALAQPDPSEALTEAEGLRDWVIEPREIFIS